MGNKTNSILWEGERNHLRNVGQVTTLNSLNISIAVLTLIKRKEVIQISHPTECTLRIYCQPCLNNTENQAILEFLETSLNVHVDIKRDPWQNFIDFDIY